MKLDDTVCRGSLIIDKGETYVVLALGWEMTKYLYSSASRTWRITPTPKNGEWLIMVRYIDAVYDVDTFFGGAVFEIPDYIR